MSGLWVSIKGHEGPKTAVVNDDLIEASDPVRGAPVRAPARRVAFKPMEPVTLDEAMRANEMRIDEIMAGVELLNANDGEEPRAMITLEQQSVRLPMMDVSDLLAEDPAPAAGKPGRPRMFDNNAQRQKAYRLRRKFGDLI